MNESNHLHHILITGTAHTEPYTSPKSGGKRFERPARQREDHGQKLLRRFDKLRKEAANITKEQEAFGIDAGNGIYLQFESEPGFDLKFESLETLKSGIELMAVTEREEKTLATVFVPEGKLPLLTKKFSDYLEKETDKGTPKNRDLVESISEIRRAALEALWTDEKDVFPTQDDQPLWWEVWLRAGDDPKAILDFFKDHSQKLQISIDPEVIYFPDRTVIAAYGTAAQMSRSVRLLNCIAELRKAKETAEFFTQLDTHEQREWMEDLLERAIPPEGPCPRICILDTGINRQHDLLEPFLAAEDMHACDPNWNTPDYKGHGTEMAGLAVYGDLTEALIQSGPIMVSHRLESVKMLPNVGANPPHLYGEIMAEGIARAEIQHPDRDRVVCMAVSATDDRDRGRPSSWSAKIDSLCSGADDEERRFIIVAAGNTPIEHRRAYPDSNMSDHGIHDPGQAWNALTVGAYTEKDELDDELYPDYRLVAPSGDLSPSSSTSMTWPNLWPLKPDIVMEGGNMAIDPTSGEAVDVDSLQLLTTYFEPIMKPFTVTGETSAATALAARMAATLMAQYPEYWPETLRALLVHSAEWTPEMCSRFNLKNKSGYRQLLRYCGYGAPSLEGALWSAQNAVTLIAQDYLQPFDKKDSRYVTRDLNLHAIPWPTEVLQALGETPVEMRVTLSYFIEPNPARRGWGRKYSYASHGLRFDVKRPTETFDEFRARINSTARSEESGRKAKSPEDKYWTLGENLRKLGSIHSDIWKNTAADLADRGHIAVYPVMGWWRENPRHGRWGKQARYSLVVSIKAPETDIDLYSVVQNLVKQAVPVRIPRI